MDKFTQNILINIYNQIEIQNKKISVLEKKFTEGWELAIQAALQPALKLDFKIEGVKKDLLEMLDFAKVTVELRKEINEHMQLIHDISGINLTQQNQLDNIQKQIDYIVGIIADHIFWEKGEDNRFKNFKAKIEEIKNEKID